MAARNRTDISLAYAVAGWALMVVLAPIFLFGVEAALTQFNHDLWIASTIADYYDQILSDESETGFIVIVHKLIIPVFAFLSVNKTWRKKYKKSQFIVFWSTLIAFFLIFVYEYILSNSTIQERLDLFNISYGSIIQYFQLYQYPLGILLGSLVGLKLFQEDDGG